MHNILEFRPCVASHYKASADIKRNIFFSPLTIDTQRDPRKTERSYHKFDSSIDDVLKFSKWLTFFFQEYLLFVYGLDFDINERIFEFKMNE